MLENRGYQRKHLRAPYREDILFVDKNIVFKGAALNISESGMLLEEVSHFPENDEIGFLINLPQLPLLKNFDLKRLSKYSADLLPSRVIRFKAKLARKISIPSLIDGELISQIGLSIHSISKFDKAKVSNYIDVFSSNLIYLQVLLDTINSDKENLLRVRLVASLLRYPKDIKVSQLRQRVEADYRSLQWL